MEPDVVIPDAEMYPTFSEDLFAPDVLQDSTSAFTKIRDLGDVVWSPRFGLFIVGRFDDVRAGLRANDTLISGKGVSVNAAITNPPLFSGRAGVISMDGDEHLRRKRLLMKPLMPQALQNIRARLEAEAAAIIDAVEFGQEFDAMTEVASQLPIRVVSQVVGLTAGLEQVLDWSTAAFDSSGPPDHPRVVARQADLQEFRQYVMKVNRDTVKPGSWTSGLFDAVERGDLSQEVAVSMVFDYATPSLDTTIIATGELLWRMATVEGAYDAVRNNPELIPSAVNEAVRMASPVRGFTRFAMKDFQFSERTVPAGAWVFLLNGSANFDERHYTDPQRFDVARNPRDQVAWGHGAHLCAGIHLARLEMEVLLRALVERVGRIEAGPPTRLINCGLQGYSRLPLSFFPR